MALVGRPRSQIPGVPQIGPKRAAALLRAHGNLEEILLRAERGEQIIYPRALQHLRDHADAARLRRLLLGTRPVPGLPDLETFSRRPVDIENGAGWCDLQGFTKLAQQLRSGKPIKAELATLRVRSNNRTMGVVSRSQALPQPRKKQGKAKPSSKSVFLFDL